MEENLICLWQFFKIRSVFRNFLEEFKIWPSIFSIRCAGERERERSLSFFETNNVNWHLHVRRLEREHDKASLYSLTVDGELGCNRIFVLRSRMKEWQGKMSNGKAMSCLDTCCKGKRDGRENVKGEWMRKFVKNIWKSGDLANGSLMKEFS